MRNLQAVSFTKVELTDTFWKRFQETNRTVTLETEREQCEQTGRIDAMKLDWKEGKPNKPHIFWDSDLAKGIEAASYSLASHPDKKLEACLDKVIALIVKAQAEDGYFNSYFQQIEPENCWTNLRDRHELYCAGHLIEAAVAHFETTGKRSLLDAMCRFADNIASVFGTKKGQKRGYCGHEEIELALVKLARVTGVRKYLELSKYFVEERGRKPYYYDVEAKARGEDPTKRHRAHETEEYGYFQAHRPVREQDTVTGHSVRAMYLYCAMADLAREYQDESLLKACERLWTHLCEKNMYVTGGIGSSRHNEGFTFDYDLPNETAYAETCANIGLVFWAHRMLQLTADGRYADVLERALYNGVISGVSLDGKKFFYENRLATTGDHHRQAWFGCACCPPNIARLLASLGGYLYAHTDHELYVNIYAQSKGEIKLDGHTVTIEQKTKYPWNGDVALTLSGAPSKKFALLLRIPSWCHDWSVTGDGDAKTIKAKMVNGYLRIEREWKKSETIRLRFEMPVEQIRANPRIRQDIGKIALQRGPIVYCVEETDLGAPVHQLLVRGETPLKSSYKADLLGGVCVVTGKGKLLEDKDWGRDIYRPEAPKTKPVTFTAVPYFAWDNRKPGSMAVWLERA